MNSSELSDIIPLAANFVFCSFQWDAVESERELSDISSHHIMFFFAVVTRFATKR
jgi:hypothetical protein